ncbi:V-type ATP synthase subunit D [Syntrophorhabdus aromaticivorans]|jgi:V/A-type H+-transporting ATPase subunit D|uniref:V-type ATP synthase subunit D n=1 Tax=Syntrophorhabdus aromaticivorans TaxID=328301 RepID=A0A351U067_9BACT|nr:V-type ATP synthase subunit D [Syntrophorhabdus aromaticivorans]NLW34027.1 V-type ATP synthase subunit D [Syntrophorhabdus aromaticivorans]HBA53348.1 V-type ATP synthase subunit D [Syntrophorhabdus aromaticivorans]
MGKLNIAPTKSNLLVLKRQLAFAEEGYDLLEQKRQILIFELMSRLGRARDAEQGIHEALREAFDSLREARLDNGSEAIDRAALAVKMDHQADVSDQHLMGIKIPHVTVKTEPVSVQFGVGGTSANTDQAMGRFVALLPLLAELAELENAVIRLARELRKTQRRCNALSKTFMPTYRETINYITGALEERERESSVILKMIRDRLGQTPPENT